MEEQAQGSTLLQFPRARWRPMRPVLKCGDRVDGVGAGHVWREGARLGDRCQCGAQVLDLTGLMLAASAVD